MVTTLVPEESRRGAALTPFDSVSEQEKEARGSESSSVQPVTEFSVIECFANQITPA